MKGTAMNEATAALLDGYAQNVLGAFMAWFADVADVIGDMQATGQVSWQSVVMTLERAADNAIEGCHHILTAADQVAKGIENNDDDVLASVQG